MNVQIEPSWKQHLLGEFDKGYFVGLTNSVRAEYSQYTCYPPGKLCRISSKRFKPTLEQQFLLLAI